jgi:two-component system sensor histidine kinase KdpD
LGRCPGSAGPTGCTSYAPERVDAALSRSFRVGNLTALREPTLLWVAGRVDGALRRYRSAHSIAGGPDRRQAARMVLVP